MALYMALLLLTAPAAQPEPLDPAQSRVWPGEAAGWVKACGFPDVELSYDATLQEYVIHVRGAANASDEQLGCAARASLNSDQYVDFPEPVNRRYQQVYWPLAEDSGRREARAWLARRGLLKKLPVYVRGKTDDATFAHQLEHLCGPAANGALAVEDGLILLKDAKHRRPMKSDTFACLSNALWASGVQLGSGTEYYPSND